MKRIKSLFAFTLSTLALFCCCDLHAATVSVPTPKASDGKYSGYVLIKWSKVKKATGGYYIFRATSSRYSKAKAIAKVSKSTTKYKDKSAAKGKKYYYWVCPIRSGYYYYNESKYNRGYRKKSTSSTQSGSSSANGINGDSKLSYGRFNPYCLVVNGVPMLSTSVRWSCSTGASMLGTGGCAKLLADKRPSSSSVKVTITAVYSKKTYKKTVTIYRTGTYGKAGTTVNHLWRFCTRHGWYDAVHSSGCPACKKSY